MVRKAKTYDWDDLHALMDRWEKTFGETLLIGFEVGPGQVPIIKKCLRLKDQKPLDDYIKKCVDQGIVF